VSGVAMLGVGLHLAGVFPRFAAIERLGAPLWRRVQPIAKRQLPVRSVKTALALGGIWGLVPCAMVYTALVLGASTGSPFRSALVLVAFGLGTTPMLLSFSAVARKMSQQLKSTGAVLLRRAAGAMVTAAGAMSVIAGLLASQAPSSGVHDGVTCVHNLRDDAPPAHSSSSAALNTE
jgi:uncharacterized protein